MRLSTDQRRDQDNPPLGKASNGTGERRDEPVTVNPSSDCEKVEEAEAFSFSYPEKPLTSGDEETDADPFRGECPAFRAEPGTTSARSLATPWG